MKKILLTAALVGGLFWNASAQNNKTTTKTKTASGTTTTTTTSQENNAGPAEQTSTSNSGGFFSRAQSSGNGGDMKATSGDITLEANVNILNSNVSLSNSLNQIRGRYFLSDDIAARLGLHVSFNTNNPTVDTKTRDIQFSIAPGIEKHFAGTNRLSPYVAAELLVGLRSTHSETDGPGSINTEVKGSFGPNDNANRGYFLVGLAGVGGCDFYVARHLFIGYELSMELSNRSFSEIETITTDNNGNVFTNKNDGSSSFSFGPNVRNGIRVGFVF